MFDLCPLPRQELVGFRHDHAGDNRWSWSKGTVGGGNGGDLACFALERFDFLPSLASKPFRYGHAHVLLIEYAQ